MGRKHLREHPRERDTALHKDLWLKSVGKFRQFRR